MMSELVVLPAYNEQENLEQAVESLIPIADWDILVVDDGSEDDTAGVARRLARKHPRVEYVRLSFNAGIGTAVQTGFLYAVNRGYRYVGQYDGDGQHCPISLRKLMDHAKQNKIDLCIGSRFIHSYDHGSFAEDSFDADYICPVGCQCDPSGNFESTWLRQRGIFFFSHLMRLFISQRITDPTSGMRVYGPRAVSAFANCYPDDYPEPEAVFWCLRHGFSVTEMPARMKPRKNGKSSIRSFYYMVKVTAAILFDTLRARECVGEIPRPIKDWKMS